MAIVVVVAIVGLVASNRCGTRQILGGIRDNFSGRVNRRQHLLLSGVVGSWRQRS
jgi:hypothetical protein